jgi:hypothetical protein
MPTCREQCDSIVISIVEIWAARVVVVVSLPASTLLSLQQQQGGGHRAHRVMHGQYPLKSLQSAASAPCLSASLSTQSSPVRLSLSSKRTSVRTTRCCLQPGMASQGNFPHFDLLHARTCCGSVSGCIQSGAHDSRGAKLEVQGLACWLADARLVVTGDRKHPHVPLLAAPQLRQDMVLRKTRCGPRTLYSTFLRLNPACFGPTRLYLYGKSDTVAATYGFGPRTLRSPWGMTTPYLVSL